MTLLRKAAVAGAVVGVAIAANNAAGKPIPFLRSSFLRFATSMRRFNTSGQVGDGRELALSAYVTANARRDDIDDVIAKIDDFARHRSYLVNIGDEKGLILDHAVANAQPKLILELGTYCGYSALRIARAMPPGARLISIEPNPANAAIARQIWEHAGVAHRITAIVGMIGDSGATIDNLRSRYGFADGTVDFVFFDHNKEYYLPDLRRILDQNWLHAGSVLVADNVKAPGAPELLEYLRANEATGWTTVEHETHAEYQRLIKDLVTESVYLGEESGAPAP